MSDRRADLKAPFPWFGGKSRAAEVIWTRLGADVSLYCEPFFGSGAVFLSCPPAFAGAVTLNDLDGHVVNFWRSVAMHPEETARAAVNPVFEADLHARHLALLNERERLTLRLCADVNYCEPLLAGWWAWGASAWIGSGWCGGGGPWTGVPDEEGVARLSVDRKLPHLTGGRGVNRKLPHLTGGRGVNRQLPRMTGGQGVNRQLPRMTGGDRLAFVRVWFAELAEAFREARVACGDWRRVCAPGTLTGNGVAAVLMDPPYSQTAAVYAKDSSCAAHEVREWCAVHGDNPLLRIVLCGHAGEHEALEALGWTVLTWDKGGGYQGADDRERLWCSPHCLRPESEMDLFGGGGI